MTTVGLPDTPTYTTIELVSCLVARSGPCLRIRRLGFESLRARPAQRRFPSLWRLAGAVWQAAPVAEWRPVDYCAAVAPQSDMTEARAHEEDNTRPCASSQAPALWTDQHGLVGG